MRLTAFIGALVGAGIGALVWAGVASLTGLEIGWIAWGLGGVIGLGAALGGGRGATTGAVCAGLALLSIYAGKYLAVDMIAEREIRSSADLFATIDLYQETKHDAEGFVGVTDDAECAEFMIEHGYSDEEYAEDVPAFALAAFRTDTAPILREFQARQPTYAQWKRGLADQVVGAWEASGSIGEVVTENLSAMDIIFALLGVATAFQVGARGRSQSGRIPYRPQDNRQPPAPATDDPAMQAGSPPVSDAPILRDEAPNPYAYPGPDQRPKPAAPIVSRTIPRTTRTPAALVGQPAGGEQAGSDPNS